jgi:hypothetical protein
MIAGRILQDVKQGRIENNVRKGAGRQDLQEPERQSSERKETAGETIRQQPSLPLMCLSSRHTKHARQIKGRGQKIHLPILEKRGDRSMKYFHSAQDISSLKTEYRDLIKQYHPDLSPASELIMKIAASKY